MVSAVESAAHAVRAAPAMTSVQAIASVRMLRVMVRMSKPSA